ncbi:hypothetical protein BSZ39_05850 [Bowdeniella nasicola]|uniref:N-acetyltransferase domain-containing protein n=1 Tax=Bowdeniella nasicola TaxID=208480 RepID=A0A1Q5Q2R7_9ACTO|nr:GNAT family N-acetyltransferase [Bowdeniella nasicola]OKL54131.1 hypothetical protein BSZ39_05850 [Bowdeniella nasicola]
MASDVRYPSQWEADVVLRDGATMHIRPVTPADEEHFRSLHSGQSDSSIYYRFFAPRANLSEKDIADFLHVDQERDVSLALFEGRGENATMAAIGGFNTTRDSVAEVAFYVADSQHGRGLGSVLLDHLAAAAREVGVHTFEAFVLPQNRKMINVFKDAGYRLTTSLNDGVIEVLVDLRSTTEAWRVMMQREQHSEALAMEALMAPTGFVLVDEDGRLEPLEWRLASQGADVVAADTEDLAGRLALVACPTDRLSDILDGLGSRGVRATIVYSGHHIVDSETSLRLLRTARSHGMRLLGPASHGIVTADGIDLTLSESVPTGGDIDLFVQSAEVGIRLTSSFRRSGLALNTMVAAGHRLDISGNDTMQFWAAHPGHGPAVICLDTVGNARKFTRIARHLATQRPILALITPGAGSDMLPGHLVSTSAEGPRVLHHILDQSGIIATRSPRELVDLTRVLAQQGPPAGTRLGIISSSAALLTTITASAHRYGLEVTGSRDLDLVAPEIDQAALSDLQGACDAVVVALTALTASQAARLDDLCRELMATPPLVPWVAVLGGINDPPMTSVPLIEDTENAVALIARLAHAQVKRSQLADAQLIDIEGIQLTEARAFVHERADAEAVQLTQDESLELLACYGINALRAITATDEDTSVADARELGYPVVLKSSQKALRHRADLGGVVLDLSDDDAVVSAARRFVRRGEQSWDVQRMAPAGAACVISAWEDRLYGPVISFALAGDAEEILHDISYRIAPLTTADARHIIGEVKTAVRLRGYRGLPTLDEERLADLIGRISLLKDDLSDVSRIRLHPVIVGEEEVHVAGAEIWVQQRRRHDDARRALPTPNPDRAR